MTGPSLVREARSRRGTSGLRVYTLYGWVLVLALFGAWELAVRSGALTSPSYPPPSEVLLTLGRSVLDGQLTGPLLESLVRVAQGYGLAVCVGLVVGLLMGCSARLGRLLDPVVELVRPLPVTALVPVLILFVGIGSSLKVLSAFLVAVFPVLLNTVAGVRSVTRTMWETTGSYRFPRRFVLYGVVVPAAAPNIFVGLRLALNLSLIVTIATEMLAGNDGLGYALMLSQQTLSVRTLYAGVILLALVGYLLNLVVVLVQRRVVFWEEERVR